jgi:hypothetical protein
VSCVKPRESVALKFFTYLSTSTDKRSTTNDTLNQIQDTNINVTPSIISSTSGQQESSTTNVKIH